MYYVLTDKNAQLSLDASNKNFYGDYCEKCVFFERKYVDLEALLADRDEIMMRTDLLIGVAKSVDQKRDISTLRKVFPQNTKILAITDGMNHFEKGELLASGATEILPFPNFTEVHQVSLAN